MAWLDVRLVRYGWLVLLVWTLGFSLTNQIHAADLLDVYSAALANDPRFKMARSKWLAQREGVAIKQAALWPQIAVNAMVLRAREWPHAVSAPPYTTNYGYGVIVNQPVINLAAWVQVTGAKAMMAGAQARFLFEEELLLDRVVEQYFAVLLAEKVLQHTCSNRQSNERLYKQAQQKFKVGVVAITDLQEARRNVESALADELGSRHQLEVQLEKLQEITNVKYSSLVPLGAGFPLLSPQPQEIAAWTKYAEQQNFSLQAAHYDSLAAYEVVKVSRAGHAPSVNLSAEYNNQYVRNQEGTGGKRTMQFGVVASLPIFSGGGVVAATRQAIHGYQEALANEEKTYRETMSSTRQAYLAVLSSLAQLKARSQAVIAAEEALKSFIANYRVGLRTISDVLEAQTKVYSAQVSHAQAECNYITSFIRLKLLTGNLNTQDLQEINSWLRYPTPRGKLSVSNNGEKKSRVSSHRAHGTAIPRVKRDAKARRVKGQVIILREDPPYQI